MHNQLISIQSITFLLAYIQKKAVKLRKQWWLNRSDIREMSARISRPDSELNKLSDSHALAAYQTIQTIRTPPRVLVRSFPKTDMLSRHTSHNG